MFTNRYLNTMSEIQLVHPVLGTNIVYDFNKKGFWERSAFNPSENTRTHTKEVQEFQMEDRLLEDVNEHGYQILSISFKNLAGW